MVSVELHFPVAGTAMASDHGYALFAAISRTIPEAHGADWLSVATLKGVARGDGTMHLDQRAALKVRLPHERVPLLLKLAGKKLEVNDNSITLGAPQIHMLKPSPILYARMVTIKGFQELEPFLEAVQRKLDELGVKGESAVGLRRVLKVGTHTIVGFALAVHALSDDDSIVLQERGLGGRRHMGCGMFFPISIDRVIGEPPQRMREVAG